MEPPWKYEGPPCSHVLHWQIIMAVITQLSLSPWHIYTPVRYLHVNKQLASYKNTQTHTQRNTQAEYKQRWLCWTLWHRRWLLCLSSCFYMLSSVFVTSYIKLHCMTSPTKPSRGHVNKLSQSQTVSLRRTSYYPLFSPLFYLLWGSGEERGRKEPHLVLKKAIQRVEKKYRGKIDLLWLNIFVIFVYFGGAREFGGDWEALCGSQLLCKSVRRQPRKKHSLFRSTMRVLRIKLRLQASQQSLSSTEPSHWALAMALLFIFVVVKLNFSIFEHFVLPLPSFNWIVEQQIIIRDATTIRPTYGEAHVRFWIPQFVCQQFANLKLFTPIRNVGCISTRKDLRTVY